MPQITTDELLKAGVHFGHLRKKWNPRMLPFIFAEKKGIHIIDLNKTMEQLDKTANALKNIARSGRKILFVATKKQAKEIVREAAESVNMPFVTDRWLGGMLTNFGTIRKSVKKMQGIEKMLQDGTLDSVTKKEKLILGREKAKMEKVLGGISQLNRLPSCLFLVDISHEQIALKEAHRLNIPTCGMVDTNSDPTQVDFAIPANDDATKSIEIIMRYITEAVREGLEERKNMKDELKDEGSSDENADSDENAAVSEVSEDGDREAKRPGSARKRTTGGPAPRRR